MIGCNIGNNLYDSEIVEPHDEHCKKQIGAVEEQIIIKEVDKVVDEDSSIS